MKSNLKTSSHSYFFLLTAEDPGSVYSYCSADDGLPEFVSTEDDEELPVRWQAPESLSEHRYSTASDVWAFGMLMYEVLTYGCRPYRHIGKDDEVSFHVSWKSALTWHTRQWQTRWRASK